MKKDKLLYRIYGRKTIDELVAKFNYLGNSDISMFSFLNIRVVITIIIMIVPLFLFKIGFLLGPLLALLFYVSSEYLFIDIKIKKRTEELEKDANYFFEILYMLMINGDSFTVALEKTCNNIESPLSLEFKHTIRDIKVSQNVNDSLMQLRKKIPSEIIRNVIMNLNEANNNGIKLIDVLPKQIKYLNDYEEYQVKRVNRSLPIKFIGIVIFVFLPIMVLLIYGSKIIDLLLT